MSLGTGSKCSNMKVILIGYMGSGKSSVGKILSKLLSIPFKDLDEEIQTAEGISISQIFSERGEVFFRKLENKTFKNLLSQNEGFVLSIGGGTPCYGDSLSAMLKAKDTLTVYLNTPLQVLCDRLWLDKTKRPLLAHLNTKEELLEFVGIHLFERSHFYNQAGLVIETGNDSPEQIARRIIERLF